MKAFKFFCAMVFVIVSIPEALHAQGFSVKGRMTMDAFYGIHEADTFSNGFNSRSVRMGMFGKITSNWDGLVEVDFADGVLNVTDVRLRRTFSNGGSLWLGQRKAPMGLNEITSASNITFVERATTGNIIAVSRRMGIAWDHYGSKAGYSAMVFGRALGQRGSLQGDMPVGVALRGVYAPEILGGRLHLGASVALEDLMDNDALRLRDRPEARDSKGGSLYYVDLPLTGVESTFRAGLELLFIKGPFSFEGEYLHLAVNMAQGASPAFGGFHFQTSYVLTGESRHYNTGIPGAISPSAQSGAWEIAARYSHMDLNDGEFLGGEQNNITLGLNHYVTSKLRFMLNMVFVNADTITEKPVLGVLRVQFSF